MIRHPQNASNMTEAKKKKGKKLRKQSIEWGEKPVNKNILLISSKIKYKKDEGKKQHY